MLSKYLEFSKIIKKKNNKVNIKEFRETRISHQNKVYLNYKYLESGLSQSLNPNINHEINFQLIVRKV